MDTSKEYILMSYKSLEDLKEYIPLFSKRRYMIYGNIKTFETGYWLDKVNTGNHKDWVPLWRQDQLQEIVLEKKEIDPSHKLIIDLEGFVYGCSFEFSMEQVFLAYVMDRKYEKTWDGEKWA